MPILLFRLRGVPEDEAEEVRDLLGRRGIEHYETTAGFWGTGTPGIWLRDDSRLEEARALIAEYQDRRFASERARYEALRREGRHRRMADVLRERPLRLLAYAIVILVVLYFSTMPFWGLGGGS